MTVQLGDLVNESDWLLYGVVGKKATGGSSAIPAGSVVLLNESTGVWGLAGTSAKGKLGVVVNRYPLNVDSEDHINVLTGGGKIYAKTSTILKPDQGLMPSSTVAGQVGAYVASTIGGTYAQAEVQAARDEFTKKFAYYTGLEGQGKSIGKPKTDAAVNDTVLIQLGAN